MNYLKDRARAIANEPVILGTAITAAAILFGLPADVADQLGLNSETIATGIAGIIMLAVRAKVTPTRKLPTSEPSSRIPDDVTRP